ncbi:hypothetical protein E2C01_087668 [Portunus trituberculatus]|uniref:Uncharacterized protein n=1 Tax=Portunus trituberculatus TaxID=210409 RepID=A0A5B7JE00_PORTR|nr:hypothetical protein [Portunus trituberculatus]
MPFTGTVAVQHTDKQAMDPSRLEESTLFIKATVSTPSSSFKLPEVNTTYNYKARINTKLHQ